MSHHLRHPSDFQHDFPTLPFPSRAILVPRRAVEKQIHVTELERSCSKSNARSCHFFAQTIVRDNYLLNLIISLNYTPYRRVEAKHRPVLIVTVRFKIVGVSRHRGRSTIT